MSFTLQIGAEMPDFDLPGVDGQQHTRASFSRYRLLVVAFTCNHCPYVIGSEERMKSLCLKYAPQGVGWVAINSNETENHPTDDFEHMIQRAREQAFPFPYLRDDTQEVALAYGALRTPHFYLFDADRTLRYTGRMDDNPKDPAKATTHELADAIEALLAGKSPPIELTNPIGCNVKWNGKERHWMPPEACDLV